LKIVTGFRKMAIKNIFIYETHEYYTMESQILLSDESIVSAELRKRL